MGYNSISSKTQRQVWDETLRYVRQIRDGLGMPVDKEIIETVAIMRIMGIHTAMSCGGHLRRVTGGPYIMFTSPTAKNMLIDADRLVIHAIFLTRHL